MSDDTTRSPSSADVARVLGGFADRLCAELRAKGETNTIVSPRTVYVAETLGFEPSPEPTEVRADRPFLFLLRDRVTGAVLFTGWLVDPKS